MIWRTAAHHEAERTERHLLPDVVSDLLDRNEHDAACCVRLWREHTAAARAWRGPRNTQRRAREAPNKGRGRNVDGLEL